MERERQRLDISNARRRGASRRGFTLLEVLVVIGVILLLVGIGVITYGTLDQSGKATKITLTNLQAMLGEYEAMTALREQPPYVYMNGGIVDNSQMKQKGVDFWRVPASIEGATGGDGDVKSGSGPRYQWDAVANTQVALLMFNRVPANKQLMTKIPSKQVHGSANGSKGKTPTKLTPSNDANAIDPPIILDAWNNPIVFVGKYGLEGVNLVPKKGSTDGYEFPDQTILSAGRIKTGGTLPRTTRPFFASAGPDGDFRTGDDNLYSFEQ